MEAAPNTSLEDILPSELCLAFRDARWPSTYFVHHGAFERLPGWMRLPALQEPIDIRRMCPFADVSVNHSGVHFQALMPGANAPAVDLLLRFGLTLSFSNVSHSIPGARPWLDSLADELGMVRSQADVGLFVSAPGQGLVPHFDAYDVFVVQLHGRKRWHLGRSPALTSPIDLQYAPGTPPNAVHGAMMGREGLPEGDPDPSELDTVELGPGSVMFVPRGTWHTTSASDSVSVSASVFLNVPSVAELLLEQLHHVIAQDVELRRPAFGVAGRSEVQRRRAAGLIEAAIPRIGRHLAHLSAQAALEACAAPDELGERIAKTTRFLRDPSHVLAGLEDAPSPEGVLRLRVERTDRAKPPSEPVPDVLIAPSVALPLLHWVLERRGIFAARDAMDAFPQFDLPSIASVLAELVNVHLLVLLPFAPLEDRSEHG